MRNFDDALNTCVTPLSFWRKYCSNKTGKTNKSIFFLLNHQCLFCLPLHVSAIAPIQAKYSKQIWARNKHNSSLHDECHFFTVLIKLLCSKEKWKCGVNCCTDAAVALHSFFSDPVANFKTKTYTDCKVIPCKATPYIKF